MSRHFSSECPAVSYGLGPAKETDRKANHIPTERTSAFNAGCVVEGCDGRIYKAQRCESHYRENHNRMSRDWRERNLERKREIDRVYMENKLALLEE
jgi:hypothetical protein